jgi:hypothetical protein
MESVRQSYFAAIKKGGANMLNQHIIRCRTNTHTANRRSEACDQSQEVKTYSKPVIPPSGDIDLLSVAYVSFVVMEYFLLSRFGHSFRLRCVHAEGS